MMGSMPETVFVVSAHWNYEGGHAVKAFTSEQDAKDFAKLCEEYDKTFLLAADASEWAKNHPAKINSGTFSPDSYDVEEVPFVAPTGEQQ